MKKYILPFLICLWASVWFLTPFAAEFSAPLECKSAVLMEASTGKILYAKNEDEALRLMTSINIDVKVIMRSKVAGVIRSVVGEKGLNAIKGILKR